MALFTVMETHDYKLPQIMIAYLCNPRRLQPVHEVLPYFTHTVLTKAVLTYFTHKCPYALCTMSLFSSRFYLHALTGQLCSGLFYDQQGGGGDGQCQPSLSNL